LAIIETQIEGKIIAQLATLHIIANKKGGNMTEMMKVAGGQVVSLEYTLKVDGEVVDSSTERGPIEFIQGTGNIIPGLERELYGMAVGETKDVVVNPLDGYGEINRDAFTDVPRDQFPENIPVETGIELEIQDEAGHPMHARIDKVEEKNVRLDFNHPLAGKELFFAVKIAGLREATDEEREHGHVHGQDHEE
jgi:FKBP-type peptidyl-prolyl cis-trans isomerase SlyD